MASQLDRLSTTAELPNVSIRVVALGQPEGFGILNGFVIYDEHLVTIEATSGEVVLRDPRDIRYHLDLFDAFAAAALSEPDSVAFLSALAADFRNGVIS
jgi:hypothetical protein